MRPAVHASFLRNRGLYQKRRKRTHVFSPRMLLFLVVTGVVLFIPGLALTIVGLQHTDSENQDLNDLQKVMYQAIGPVMGTVGIVVMFASCIYFNCYGTVPQTPAPLNSQQQSFSEQDQDEKGSSIRSKPRDHGQQTNGGSVDVHTPGTESKHSLKDDSVLAASIKIPHRTANATEENMPLTKMEHISVLSSGHKLGAPAVAIYVQESSDTEDVEYADEVSLSHHLVKGRIEA